MGFKLIYQNILMSEQIAWFFDYQYSVGNQAVIDFLDFLDRNSHQGREILKIVILVRHS